MGCFASVDMLPASRLSLRYMLKLILGLRTSRTLSCAVSDTAQPLYVVPWEEGYAKHSVAGPAGSAPVHRADVLAGHGGSGLCIAMVHRDILIQRVKWRSKGGVKLTR